MLDRAGVTGVDGASHNGMWDIAMCQIIPGLELYAPRDEASLRHSLRLAIAAEDRPTVVRYPKGSLPEAMPALRAVGGVDVLSEPDPGAVDVLLVATGALAPSGLKAARILEEQGIRVRVVDPIRVLPLKEGLLECAKDADLVVTIEDGLVDGGFGWALRDKCVGTRVLTLGIAKTFLEHGDRSDILAALGLDPESIAQRVRESLGDVRAG